MRVLKIILDQGDELGRSAGSLEIGGYQFEIGHFVLRSLTARSCSALMISSSAFARYSRSFATRKSESRPSSLGRKFFQRGFHDQPHAVSATGQLGPESIDLALLFQSPLFDSIQ
jgi:hypothetical protein